MQFIDSILNIFRFFLKKESFKKKYKTKDLKNLKKILFSSKWSVIDIRNAPNYQENHLKNSTNVSRTLFKFNFFKYINKRNKILLVNDFYKSNLDIYNLLKKHNYRVYILRMNYAQVAVEPKLDQYTVMQIYK